MGNKMEKETMKSKEIDKKLIKKDENDGKNQFKNPYIEIMKKSNELCKKTDPRRNIGQTNPIGKWLNKNIDNYIKPFIINSFDEFMEQFGEFVDTPVDSNRNGEIDNGDGSYGSGISYGTWFLDTKIGREFSKFVKNISISKKNQLLLKNKTIDMASKAGIASQKMIELWGKMGNNKDLIKQSGPIKRWVEGSIKNLSRFKALQNTISKNIFTPLTILFAIKTLREKKEDECIQFLAAVDLVSLGTSAIVTTPLTMVYKNILDDPMRAEINKYFIPPKDLNIPINLDSYMQNYPQIKDLGNRTVPISIRENERTKDQKFKAQIKENNLKNLETNSVRVINNTWNKIKDKYTPSKQVALMKEKLQNGKYSSSRNHFIPESQNKINTQHEIKLEYTANTKDLGITKYGKQLGSNIMNLYRNNYVKNPMRNHLVHGQSNKNMGIKSEDRRTRQHIRNNLTFNLTGATKQVDLMKEKLQNGKYSISRNHFIPKSQNKINTQHEMKLEYKANTKNLGITKYGKRVGSNIMNLYRNNYVKNPTRNHPVHGQSNKNMGIKSEDRRTRQHIRNNLTFNITGANMSSEEIANKLIPRLKEAMSNQPTYA
ncbi:MAG: hypothetical protein N4A64_07095 [Marinisporobacter sp.]|jgi:anti-sigma28 factor (negative regulator of flagellin synthesis)|nr:hypothetical protein [Marinisporobacter sp.]